MPNFTFNLNGEPAEVTEIQVIKEGLPVHLKKDKDVWQMLKPVEDEADGSAVDAFVYSAVIQKGKFFRSDDDAKATKWADYGLEPPGSTVVVTSVSCGTSIV